MALRHRPHDRYLRVQRAGAAALVMAAILVGVANTAQSQLAMPAEFVRYLSPPGQADHFKRPAAIRADVKHGELLIADPGNNRVVIFDERGFYRFAFDMMEDVTYPVDVAVDSEGFIHVLGSTDHGRRVFRFDFDGLFLGEAPTPTELDGRILEISSIAFDDADQLYLLDDRGMHVVVCDRSYGMTHSFAVDPDAAPEANLTVGLGAISVVNGNVYIPVSTGGTVKVYSATGEFLRAVGRPGNTVGQLAFPVAVAVTSDGLTLILDQRRFNVSCYDEDGVFRGEFGGKGVNPGWFYFPSLLAVGQDGQVVIGQIFENTVQVCRIPESIRQAARRGNISSSQPKESSGS